MDFTEKLRLRGKAEEDMYFAALDRQLIEAMHEKQKLEDELLKSQHSDDPTFDTGSHSK
ncbi:hypothetical protein ACPV4B_16665 [Vibrio parahaemolyticus]|uniref:Uncharacterized protein n=1 Tax=Vibrio hangzhouensis TaxID=462991 RepID=A0A1H5X582_9VIBR|nr:hypothetical protein [Vibrio hangzhouensis]SEG06922.1 hypothetical protein SAMN04488244_106213 [Vibrio hangzhouensis]